MENVTAAEALSKEMMKQHRRDRLWRNVRFMVGASLLVYYGLFVAGNMKDKGGALVHPKQPYVSLVRMNGEISAGSEFSAVKVIPELQRAFSDPASKGVVLDINSPGGSPVQSTIIHDKILELKHQFPQKKVIVVGEDSLASGAYLVAVAADKIFVNPGTITGSIGVVMRGFGFGGAMEKVGIKRRVFTSGGSKSRMDPFEPLKEKDVVKMRRVLDQVHQLFIADVVAGRGKRLHGDPKQLFSGDFWTGEEAVALGLVDGNANLWQVLALQYHVNQYHDYTNQPTVLQRLVKGVASEVDVHYRAETAPGLSAELSY